MKIYITGIVPATKEKFTATWEDGKITAEPQVELDVLKVEAEYNQDISEAGGLNTVGNPLDSAFGFYLLCRKCLEKVDVTGDSFEFAELPEGAIS